MRKLSFLVVFVAFFAVFNTVKADSELLTPEENLWLKSRNNTIVVYPENSGAPFSYQTPGGSIEGLSIDYIELIADKIGAKIQYLTPRSKSQVIQDAEQGKGDVLLSLTESPERDQTFLFTESYVTVPVVIVVRKDVEIRKTLTLSDFTGKRVAMIEGSAIEEYVQKNYPRVVIESVTDDEVGLQKIVLGETDAAVMDAASLSYLLSKQVLNSVKVVGNTGFDYRPAFAMTKDKEMLQSILEKGMAKISPNDRQILIDKWVVLPGDEKQKETFLQRLQTSSGVLILYVLLGISIIGIFILILHRKKVRFSYAVTPEHREVDILKTEVSNLENENKALTHELEEVRHLEEEIAHKLDDIKKQ